MRFDVFTTFPDLINYVLSQSILGRGQKAGKLEVVAHDLRDFTTNRHRTTDDAPYGGGAGMVMKPEPVWKAVRSVFAEELEEGQRLLLTTPQGRVFDQSYAKELAGCRQI